MKKLEKLLFLFCLVSLFGCKSANKKEPVIFAVNVGEIGLFLDENGSFLFGKQYEHVSRFNEGYAPVKSNGKYGFINTKGEVVVPCIYDLAHSFYEGYATVESNGKWGVVDKKGRVIIQPIYDYVSPR